MNFRDDELKTRGDQEPSVSTYSRAGRLSRELPEEFFAEPIARRPSFARRILKTTLIVGVPAIIAGAWVGRSSHRSEITNAALDTLTVARAALAGAKSTAAHAHLSDAIQLSLGSSDTPAKAATSARPDAAPDRRPAQEVAASATGDTVKVAPSSPPTGCLADPAAIEDIQHRRDDLARREQELTARQQELEARERDLQEELAKIQNLRDEIKAVETLQQSQNEEKVAKLVATIEGMSPKAGAQLMANVEEALAVTAMTRIDTTKLSKIMNVMDAEKASRLSELLTGAARVKSKSTSGAKAQPGPSAALGTSNGVTVAANQSAKGGERNNGNVNHANSEQQQRASASPVVDRQPAAQKR